jgi:hypothetical protein
MSEGLIARWRADPEGAVSALPMMLLTLCTEFLI